MNSLNVAPQQSVSPNQISGISILSPLPLLTLNFHPLQAFKSVESVQVVHIVLHLFKYEILLSLMAVEQIALYRYLKTLPTYKI
jgi:hypothetical protein